MKKTIDSEKDDKEDDNIQPKKIIVIGGSAGGLKVIINILSQIDKDIPAAIVVILHLAENTSDSLIKNIKSFGINLPLGFAKNGEALEESKIYIAPPRSHCLIVDKKFRLTKGPRVNRVRPAIDLTFRSAAVDYGHNSLGVIVSGMRDDGVTGLQAVKNCGGIIIVQDPKEADYPEMPKHSLLKVEPESVLSTQKIAAFLNEQVHFQNRRRVMIPPSIILENQMDLNNSDDISKMHKMGTQIPATCTDCGGPLWEIKDKKHSHYRCHVGHVLSEQSLLKGKDEQLEQSLWVAYRTLEEKLRMLEQMAISEELSGRSVLSDSYRKRTEETKVHVEKLRKFLYTFNESLMN